MFDNRYIAAWWESLYAPPSARNELRQVAAGRPVRGHGCRAKTRSGVRRLGCSCPGLRGQGNDVSSASGAACEAAAPSAYGADREQAAAVMSGGVGALARPVPDSPLSLARSHRLRRNLTRHHLENQAHSKPLRTRQLQKMHTRCSLRRWSAWPATLRAQA